jgi:hypothetical protein
MQGEVYLFYVYQSRATRSCQYVVADPLHAGSIPESLYALRLNPPFAAGSPATGHSLPHINSSLQTFGAPV